MDRIAFASYRGQPTITADDQLLADALSAHNIAVEGVPWDASIDWGQYAAVLPRSTWDFHLRLPQFREWLARVDAAGVTLINQRAVVEWNASKRYLQMMEAGGVPIVPTTWIEPGGTNRAPQLHRLHHELGFPTALVIKPVVSASAHDTWLASGTEEVAEQQRFEDEARKSRCGLMVQPFMPEIQTNGEWSLMLFGGRFSHAVRKRPATGDFRVQRDHGGTAVADTPSPQVIQDATFALARAAEILGLQPADIIYVRVDGIERNGRLVLMEFEALEPVLFFGLAAPSAERMAACVRAALTLRLPSTRPHARGNDSSSDGLRPSV